MREIRTGQKDHNIRGILPLPIPARLICNVKAKCGCN